MQQTDFFKNHASVIHNRKIKMDKYWNIYTLTLLKQITLTEGTYYHQVVPCQSGRLMIKLFGGIQFDIIRTNSFGNVTIDYQLTAQGLENMYVPSSYIDEQGMLDGSVLFSDKHKVFEHYLNKLQPLYVQLAELSAKGHL